MPNTDDKPVTHKELREKLDEAITQWAKQLTADLTQRLTQVVVREVAHSVTQVVAREVAHSVKSSEESTRSYLGAMLDKASANDEKLDGRYSDLPARVTRLEAAVFPPKRQRRR